MEQRENRRMRRDLGLAAALLCLAGCSSLYEVPYADAVEENRKALNSEKGLGVEGYVDAKDGRERWTARAFLERDGAITFRREEVEPETIRLPRRQVKALIVSRVDGKKVGAGVLAVVGGAAYAVGAALAGMAMILSGG